ncbi:MAG: hypothetical protein M4D80_11000 [Myxococcota bacterium]|nr:hypothetical protein [Deltaproteobacteria bacterium]MDQ3335685.1 hypothetical protein [Myxococcota bacterium]
MRRLALLFVFLAGCTKAGTGNESPPGEPSPKVTPAVAPIPVPAKVTPAPKAATRIELTAVTLADDCNGAPPWNAPAPSTKGAKAEVEVESNNKSKSRASKQDMAGARASRRCEQTSMQLTIIAGDASNIQVKSVELFDDAGKSLGMLTASKPTRWSDTNGIYEAWDQNVAASSTSNVSYVLAQPKWDGIGNRWNRTYTLKTVLSVGGVDQTAEKAVTLTLSAPTSLPPNVKT